ncbi:MAG: GAF domain-containing sensor histidine kinase, partial [Pseudomonadales bacterium]
MSLYEQALEDANRAGYINDVALIAESCGRFHLRYGRNAYARYHISIAIRNYQRWGAEAKARALQNEFPDMTGRLLNEATKGGFVYSTNKNLLDLETVTRASQVLAGEVVLERVLERLLQTALLNAGGHCASLILRSDEELRVEITTWMNDSETESRLNSLPVNESDEVPISIIQYVARTREDLVLNDAVNDDIFTQDQYILREQPQSIICIPIESQSQLIGILYVENSHSTHAFSQERISVLKLLAAQSSIALANASLYQQLSDSRNKYLSLYENAVEGIFEVDAEGNLTNINPAGLTLLGYRNIREIRQAIQARITSFFLEPEDFREIQRQIGTHGRINGFETRLVQADGTPIWVALSAQVVRDPLSGSWVLEGSMLNIDERKAREEAEQARLVAEAQTATKSQFLANMSHEIRTPMNAILGYTDIMLETELDETRRANLQTIQDASNHLLHVVNDILDLSKFESGKISINKSPFTLSSLFREMENLFRLEAKRKSLDLEVPVITPTDEPTLEGDSVRIGQVLINLLSNALKFTETGSVRLSYKAEDADNGEVLLRFQVNDTGIGIDPESLDSIFDTFDQGNTASNETGTGLGLSISRKLAEAMG